MLARLVLLVAALVVVSSPRCTALAQQGEAGEVSILRKDVEARTLALKQLGDKIRQLELEKTSGSQEVLRSYNASYVKFYEYQNNLRNHSSAILYWQLFSSYTLLGLVVLVTSLGVGLSFLEVRKAIQIPDRFMQAMATTPPIDRSAGSALDPADAGPAQTVHQLEISAQRLQITSAVTGVVILVLSLGFLYIFVDRVLELDPTDMTSRHTPARTVVPDGSN